MSKKNIIREIDPRYANFDWEFDDDALTERGGDWNYNLFIVGSNRVGSFNGAVYKEVKETADEIRYALGEIAAKSSYREFMTIKEVMENWNIPYSAKRAHALKEWADGGLADCDDADTIAEYLTITTGEKWDATGVTGYCQGDYVEVVYCEKHHPNPARYGEIWLGCAKEFAVKESGSDDWIGGYIVAESDGAWDEDKCFELVCDWACLDPAETVWESEYDEDEDEDDENDEDEDGSEAVDMLLRTAEISFEISESILPLDRIIAEVEKAYPAYKFSRTESRYESCVMAIFERRTA